MPIMGAPSSKIWLDDVPRTRRRRSHLLSCRRPARSLACKVQRAADPRKAASIDDPSQRKTRKADGSGIENPYPQFTLTNRPPFQHIIEPTTSQTAHCYSWIQSAAPLTRNPSSDSCGAMDDMAPFAPYLERDMHRVNSPGPSYQGDN